MNLLSGLKKMLIFTSLLPSVLYRIMREALWSKGIGKDRRVGKLSFLEKLRLPQSFAFSAVSGLVPSTPLFLLWHRRLGHVCSPLDILFPLECWGLYLTLRFRLVWGASWEKTLPFLY